MPDDQPVDLETLAQAVRDMRAVQREFFTTRRPACLLRAKELEAVVDRMVEEVAKKTT